MKRNLELIERIVKDFPFKPDMWAEVYNARTDDNPPIDFYEFEDIVRGCLNDFSITDEVKKDRLDKLHYYHTKKFDNVSINKQGLVGLLQNETEYSTYGDIAKAYNAKYHPNDPLEPREVFEYMDKHYTELKTMKLNKEQPFKVAVFGLSEEPILEFGFSSDRGEWGCALEAEKRSVGTNANLIYVYNQKQGMTYIYRIKRDIQLIGSATKMTPPRW